MSARAGNKDSTGTEGQYRDRVPVRIEREVYGKSLDFGERIIWKRWLETQNQKFGRRSRLKAPCCGKSTFRFRLLPDEQGFLFCPTCLDAQHKGYAQPGSSTGTQEAAPPGKRPLWRDQSPSGKRQQMTADDVHNILLGVEAVAW